MSKSKKIKKPMVPADIHETGQTGNNIESLEMDILLSLSKDIASVRSKEDLFRTIYPKLKQLFATDDIFICKLDKANKTLNPILRVSDQRRNEYTAYRNIVNTDLPIHDGFIDTILNAKSPLIFDIEEVNKWLSPPSYMPIVKAAGLVESLSIALCHGDDPIGILTLWSEKKYSFTPHHLQLIGKIAPQISFVITNILAEEAAREREQENEALLLISNEIASIRNKGDLAKIFSTTLKKYIHFNDVVVMIYNKDRNVYQVYICEVEEKRLRNPDFQAAMSAEYPLLDSDLSNAHMPTIIDVEFLVKYTNSPATFIHKAGIKEISAIKLIDGDRLIGLFVLLSEQLLSFPKSALHIMQRISYQISIAVAKLLANDEIERREAEKTLLLSLSNEMSLVRSKEDLARIINQKLKKLFSILDYTIVVLQGAEMTYGPYLFDPEDTPFDKKTELIDKLFNNYKFEEGFYDVVLQTDEPVIFDIDAIMATDEVPGHISFFHSLGIKVIVGAALRIGERDLGILWIQPSQVKCSDIIMTNVFKGVCSQISIALANIIANEDILKRQQEKEIMLSLGNDIASIRNRTDLLNIFTHQFKKLFHYNDASIIILNKEDNTYSAFVLDMEEERANHIDCLPNSIGVYPISDGICDVILAADGPVILNYQQVLEKKTAPSWAVFLHENGINEMVCVALREGKENMGAFFLHSEEKNYFNKHQFNLIQGIAYQLSVALANVLANEKITKQLDEINTYKQQLEVENLYLQKEISTDGNYSEIIGTGTEMQKVFHLLSQVSFANSTVLILGETGTGKELIARALHNISPRKDRMMVKVNCASIPANLIESELFGHERGSFTGATDRRIGKFELANHGTLFLDEIGEIPFELQSKLLRALQEREIERIGGRNAIKIDVRIIVATNRDLEKEVNEGRFRQDLFYRLNVFPINLPPLRDRKEDIPVLAAHFISKYSRNAGRAIKNISSKVLQDLMAYDWPGNVREMEHLIERSVLLSNGDTIKNIHLPVLKRTETGSSIAELYIKTIDENERDHILSVLKKCKGKVYGKGGAAEILGVPVSTLNSKIKKFGIKKEQSFQ
ncbi:GAF domain-containing protein [Pedobacter hiemivivus]|uniref:GAF domain-containing protein n=1 Tax=Pedobacter hiemivivus TaxID=2530454 RepID=A0A4U1GNW9_9SPHI|nr:sigma 54-interacting transcriptional regulator [Pedobacter hiemivivus]TKC65199.1 GAF domain-containing protein [Pedobacter hiemivivus]